MPKRLRIIPLLALCCAFASSLWAAQPALVPADWSVNGAHNLASNPPSLDAVEEFTGRALGHNEEDRVDVCEFRFADLRSSGDLSLIVSVAPGSWGCTELYIFDRTPTGFELYQSDAADAAVGHDLANSVLDINHDGRHELVLWGDLTGYINWERAPGYGVGCEAKWPLIFTWMGNGYSAEVGDQYKDYYRNYLKSVEARLAAYSSELEAASAPGFDIGQMVAQTANPVPAVAQTANPAPAVAQTANPAPVVGSARIAGQAQAEMSSGAGVAFPAPTPEAAPKPKAAPIPGWEALNLAQQNYPCTRIEAAKTEAFLGIDSASTMSAAIKDSESDNPAKRILAAAIFSYLGTEEAEQDLKTLSNDADSKVAEVAKLTATYGGNHRPSARTIPRQVNPPGIPTASFMR
ncbi:MAG: hypothetical protein WCE23_16755 [Candidatus Binatus sp.]|uniref:hypothetical protein n=1 Tax=Candidatus Binatus sp. TaxID=2811406 RepID=UPI003C70BC0D